MAYDGRVLRRARERFEADREERRARLEEQRQKLFVIQPRLRKLDAELRGASGQILSAALRRGTDPRPALETLRRENLRLQAERREILAGMRLPETCLDEQPACSLCSDTGYRDGKMCQCLRRYYAREQQRELSRMLDLGNQSFDAFSLEWYADQYNPAYGKSPRENMEDVYDVCAEFAANFEKRPGNLLLFGSPGLGKTFLSAAVAREVSGRGFSVVYDTAGQIFARFESRKFDREEGAEDDVERVLRCDLLILDDLGTELTTEFVRSALYQIVNTRMLADRPVILNTNLFPKDIARRYSPQISSRLEGAYRFLCFFGEDIRKLKRERGQRSAP